MLAKLGLFLAWVLLPLCAGTISYNKHFFVNKVAATADIYAGGVVQTWEGREIKEAKHKVYKELELEYSHASVQTKIGKVNGGLPISKTNNNAGVGWPAGNPALAKSTVTDDNGSTASVTIDVKAIQAGPKKINAVGDNIGLPGEVNLTNYVEAKIEGSATAADKKYRTTSADSAGAVYVEGAEIYQALRGIREFTYYGKNSVLIGNSWKGFVPSEKDFVKQNPGQGDPWFVSFTDLDSGVTLTEAIAEQSLQFLIADFQIDDTGIFLAINPLDSSSYIELSFSSEFAWVANPFSYGFRFDSTGLTYYGGKLSQSPWSVNTSNPTRWEAFMPWGPNGQPYDAVTVNAPDAFNIPGRNYAMSVGTDDNVWDIHAEVPEPGSCGQLLCGLAGVLALSSVRAFKKRRTHRL